MATASSIRTIADLIRDLGVDADRIPLGKNEILDGGTVLPDFTLPVKDLFVDLDR